MNQKLLNDLEKLWKKYPKERFGQLLFNHTRFGTQSEVGYIHDIFHYQDEDILKDIKANL